MRVLSKEQKSVGKVEEAGIREDFLEEVMFQLVLGRLWWKC